MRRGSDRRQEIDLTFVLRITGSAMISCQDHRSIDVIAVKCGDHVQGCRGRRTTTVPAYSQRHTLISPSGRVPALLPVGKQAGHPSRRDISSLRVVPLSQTSRMPHAVSSLGVWQCSAKFNPPPATSTLTLVCAGIHSTPWPSFVYAPCFHLIPVIEETLVPLPNNHSRRMRCSRDVVV